MLDTSSWPRKDFEVLGGIFCDPHNVRIEIDATVETDIIEDLFVNENVLSLVEGICRVGYLTHDVPVALKRDDVYVMVEGNRRLAALKAIQNPMMVPTHQARIQALTKDLTHAQRKSLATVHAMIAPDQESADRLIAAVHTSNLRRRWTPPRQAAFFQAQIDAGRTLAELIPRYPTVDVRRFVLRAQVINRFRTIKYRSPELLDFLKTAQWRRSFSTLERILESTEFQQLTGVRMDDKGALKFSVTKTQFNEMAAIIVEGLRNGELNTRTLNSVNSVAFKALMTDLGAVISGGSGDKPKSSEEPKTTEKKAPAATAATRKPARKTRRTRVSAGELEVPDEYPRSVEILLEELSRVSVQTTPNVAVLAMRAALEKAIKAYATACNTPIEKSRHNDGKGFVQLGHALDWLLDDIKANGPKPLREPVEALRGNPRTEFTRTKTALNAVAHNEEFHMTVNEAFEVWDRMESIMKHLVKPKP